MPVHRLLDVETCHSCFTLVLSSGADGHTHIARYWNVPGRPNRLGRHLDERHHAQVTHATQEGALAIALVQIEWLDGPLLDIVELDLRTSARMGRVA